MKIEVYDDVPPGDITIFFGSVDNVIYLTEAEARDLLNQLVLNLA